MASNMSATRDGGRATFLLEMALDRARLKARLAARLYQERVSRGNGDARRFPQPQMAQLLDYSLRQYQRLEDPDDGSLPSFADMERIANRLGFPVADMYADDQPDDEADATPEEGQEEIHDLRAEVVELRQRVDLLLAHFGVETPPAAPVERARRAARR